MFFVHKDLEIAKAESRHGRAMLEREDLDKELSDRLKELDEKEAQIAVKDGQIKRLEAELVDHQKLLERKEAHFVRQKTTLQELEATMEASEARTEEERVLKALQKQLDQVRQATQSLQRQWSETEQQLLSVAMTRDHQAVQEERLREGKAEIIHFSRRVSFELITLVYFILCFNNNNNKMINFFIRPSFWPCGMAEEFASRPGLIGLMYTYTQRSACGKRRRSDSYTK